MRGKKAFNNPSVGFPGFNGANYQVEDQSDNTSPGRVLNRLEAEEALLANLEDWYNMAQQKRAPNNGFFGMRGKKLIDDYLKRAPQMGFHGMRGKKFDDFSLDNGDDDFESIDEKRAPKMGFNGMRGKRDTTDYSFRNKKFFYPDRHGFFGVMKSKKGSSDFRNKFVGVRGKKAPDGPLMKFASELDDMDQLLPDVSSIKRAPSGFLGMRGKKSAISFQGKVIEAKVFSFLCSV